MYHIAVLKSTDIGEQDVFWDENTKEIILDGKVIGTADDRFSADILIEKMFENVELDC